MVETKGCLTVCQPCGKKFIENGAEDMKAKAEKNNRTKEELIVSIMKMDSSHKRTSKWGGLDEKNTEELTKIHEKVKIAYEFELRVQEEIKESFVDTPTEDYLIEEYGI